MDVTDGVTMGRREMSLKDWTMYYDKTDRDSFLMMSAEFSRTKLEKCIELPEIVRYVLCFCIQLYFIFLTN